jgi:hypothetical protein
LGFSNVSLCPFKQLSKEECDYKVLSGETLYTWRLQRGTAEPLRVSKFENSSFIEILATPHWETFDNYWHCYAWCLLYNKHKSN